MTCSHLQQSLLHCSVHYSWCMSAAGSMAQWFADCLTWLSLRTHWKVSGLDSCVPRCSACPPEHRPTNSSSSVSHLWTHSHTSCHWGSAWGRPSWWMEHSGLSSAFRSPWKESPGNSCCLGLGLERGLGPGKMWLIAAGFGLYRLHRRSSRYASVVQENHTGAWVATWDLTWKWNLASSAWEATGFLLWRSLSREAVALC